MEEKKEEKVSNNKTRSGLYITIIIILSIMLVALATLKIMNYSLEEIYTMIFVKKEEKAVLPTIEEKAIKILNVDEITKIWNGEDRPILVMIDNEPGAYPQAGLQEASVIYECIVEGGETRMMALYKGANTTKIGPIRSARHYYVRYALEQDAIFTHFGWSPQARDIIYKYDASNVHGIYYGTPMFWREGSGYHTVFTSIANIKTLAKNLGYSLTTKKESPYTYSNEEYNLDKGTEITSVKMTYSWCQNVEYKYDEEKQVFLRFQRGEAHTDRETNQQLYAKNIVIIQCSNYNIGDGTVRQEVETIGKGKGYYITNGRYINITWSKKDVKDKTYYYDSTGKEIVLNDGLTFIQVVPTAYDVKFTKKQ